MLVLSIDVGVINMGMCLLDSETGEIINWDNVSIIGNVEVPKCAYCRNCAKWFTTTPNSPIYYCTRHLKVHVKPNPELKPANLRKLGKGELTKLAEKHNLLDGAVTKRVNVLNKLLELSQKSNVKRVPKKKSSEKIPLIELTKNAIDATRAFLSPQRGDLNETPALGSRTQQPQLALLECQMRSRMKILQSGIAGAMYYSGAEIAYVAAGYKLADLDVKKDEYSERKKSSTDVCDEIIHQDGSINAKWCNKFEQWKTAEVASNPSDAYLQAVAYLKRHA